MKEHIKLNRNFLIVAFVIGAVSLAYALIKAFSSNWNILALSRDNVMTFVMFFVGLAILYVSLRNLFYYKDYKMRKDLEIGVDERIMKIINSSLRNAGITMILGVFGAVAYYSLFYDRSELIFSIDSIRWVTFPTIAAFLLSFWYYQRSKGVS